MGSKKVKKKVKVKKAGKLLKLKKYGSRKGKKDSFDDDECQSSESFSQMRENYFSYLRNVVKENFESVDSKMLSNDDLEKISLEVEQQALLACMRSDIYQKTMIQIIRDIRKSTRNMKLYLGIKDMVDTNKFGTDEVLTRLKSVERDSICGPEEQTIEVYSQIPTISYTRTSYNDQNWTNNSVMSEYNILEGTSVNSFNCGNNFLRLTNHNRDVPMSYEAQDLMETGYPSVDDQYLSLYNCNPLPSTPLSEKLNVNVVASTPEQNSDYFPQNLVPLTSNSEESHRHNGFLHYSEETTQYQVTDPILKSRNQLQKSVENSLKSLKEIKVQKREEVERARLLRLLEDDVDDETDDNHYDSFSDNCDEPAQETNDNVNRCDLFADRLEEMRQIFGMEDEEKLEAEEEKDKKVIQECTNNAIHLGAEKPSHSRKALRPNHTWHHERIIQMYRYSMLASEMTEEMREFNRRLFLEFFGDDSDEENEEYFKREDKYIMSCKERISSWVVKYLMPFYNRKKIIGRGMFKSLGHHVSSSIIERIKYPDEWTVKYLVTNFFPKNKTFIDESDVSNFRIE